MDDKASASPSSRRMPAWPALLLAASVALALGLSGILWGLPSADRNQLIYGGDGKPAKPPRMTDEELTRLWRDYPNFLPGSKKSDAARPRSDFNAIRTYHPDEHVIIKGLARMDPLRLDVFPGFFAWPALQFYIVGGALQVSRFLGFVTLVRNTSYYFAVPVEMARIFVIGRAVTILMGLAAIAAIWAAMRKAFGGPEAMAAALFLAVTPAFTLNSHYLTADVPMVCWTAVCLWASVNVMVGGGRWWYVLAGAAAGCSAATRYQGVFACLIIFSAHVFRKADGDVQSPGRTLRRIFLSKNVWLAALTSILVFFLLNHHILLRPSDFVREISLELKFAGSASGSEWFRIAQFVSYGFGIPLALVALGGLVSSVIRRRSEDWFLLFAFGAPLVFIWLGRPVMVRYLFPGILLPVLLAACWIGGLAAARPGRRALLRRTIGWTLGCIVFVASLLQSTAYARMLALPDPWMKAGNWIGKHVPQESTVAILVDPSVARAEKDAPAPLDADPWIAQLPPINAQRFHLIGLRMRTADLDVTAPDFVVLSDMQLPPVAVRGPLNSVEAGFMDRVKNPFLYDAEEFSNPPCIFGLNFKTFYGPPPHDLRYADPGITIYRTIEEKAP